MLEDHATRLGCEFVATGHYVRRRENVDRSVDVLAGADPNKDQSYFLALVRQENLRRAWFPVGHLLKPQVRELARCAGLPQALRGDEEHRRGVLVKRAKPTQEQRVDLPTIGMETVEGAARAGLAGVVGQAGRTLLLDREAVIAAADRLGLFVYGYEEG